MSTTRRTVLLTYKCLLHSKSATQACGFCCNQRFWTNRYWNSKILSSPAKLSDSQSNYQARVIVRHIMKLNTLQALLLSNTDNWQLHHFSSQLRCTKVGTELTALRMAFPCRLDNISSAVRACSATSIHWITCNYQHHKSVNDQLTYQHKETDVILYMYLF